MLIPPLTPQRPTYQSDPTVPPSTGLRVRPAFAIGLAVAAVIAAVLIYQARQSGQTPQPFSSAACSGGFTNDQLNTIMQTQVSFDPYSPVTQHVPISADAALQAARTHLGSSGASATCLVERLEIVSDPGDVLVSGRWGTYQEPMWVLIFQGLGDSSTAVGQGPASASAPDLVGFVDAYTADWRGDISIKSSTEQ